MDCRHNGHSLLCGRYDMPLSAAGHRQVLLLRQRLAVEPPFVALYSSPLPRALATAEAAPPEVRPSLRTLNSLSEISCGVLDGTPIDHVRLHYPDLWARNEAQTDEDFSWPGGESYRRFRNRVLRAFGTLARRHAGQRTLIVTHAGVINQVVGAIAGQSAARWQNLRPRNASITRVLWDGRGGVVECFDDASYL